MKKNNELRFPYPFLQEDGGDYLDSKFVIDFDVEKNKDTVELICKCDLKCPFIEELIERNEAVILIHIEQRTYRHVFLLNEKSKIIIPINKLSPGYNIEVVGMIISKKTLRFNYHESMNKIYSFFDGDFCCEKTAILGFSNFTEFELPEENRVSSIFTISEYKDSKDILKGEPYKIDLDGNVINIQVMPKIKEIFIILRIKELSHNKLFNSLFVYPAIQIAIIEMFKDYDAHKDKKWCISLFNKLCNEKECSVEVLRGNRNNLDKDEVLEFTHIILEDLLTSSFEEAFGEE